MRVEKERHQFMVYGYVGGMWVKLINIFHICSGFIGILGENKRWIKRLSNYKMTSVNGAKFKKNVAVCSPSGLFQSQSNLRRRVLWNLGKVQLTE